MVPEIYETIGAAIRKRREAIGMTQAVLANEVGLSRTSVTNIERGGQALLVHQLLDLARALRISPQALLPSPQDYRLDRSPDGDVPEEIRLLLERLRGGRRSR